MCGAFTLNTRLVSQVLQVLTQQIEYREPEHLVCSWPFDRSDCNCLFIYIYTLTLTPILLKSGEPVSNLQGCTWPLHICTPWALWRNTQNGRRRFQLPPVASSQAECASTGDRMIKQGFFHSSPTTHPKSTADRQSGKNRLGPIRRAPTRRGSI